MASNEKKIRDTVIKWEVARKRLLSVEEYCLWDLLCQRDEGLVDLEVGDLAAHLNLSRQTVTRMLGDLIRNKLIARSGKGCYQVLVSCRTTEVAEDRNAGQVAVMIPVEAEVPKVVEETPAVTAKAASRVRRPKEQTLFDKYKQAFFKQWETDKDEVPQWDGSDAKAMKLIIEHLEFINRQKFKDNPAVMERIPEQALEGWVQILSLRKTAWEEFDVKVCQRVRQIQGRLTNIISSVRSYLTNGRRSDNFKGAIGKGNTRYSAGPADKVF